MLKDLWIGLQLAVVIVLSPLTAAAYYAPDTATKPFSPSLAQAPVATHAKAAASTGQLPAARPTATKLAEMRATPSASTSRAVATRARGGHSGGELAIARRLLAAQIANHPILRGVTLTFGDAKGRQAIAYYTSGRIVISPSHTASLDRIVAHEVWHIIDWRDNGRIDWGENVPR